MTEVLIAEDNAVNRELLHELLETGGYVGSPSRVIRGLKTEQKLRSFSYRHRALSKKALK